MRGGFTMVVLIVVVGVVSILAMIAYTNGILDFADTSSVVPSGVGLPEVVNTITPQTGDEQNEPISMEAAMIEGFVMVNNTGCTLGTGAECFMNINGSGGITKLIYCKDDKSKSGLGLSTGDEVKVSGFLRNGKFTACGGRIEKVN